MSAAVPPGYKQTEVGVIPGDWEVSALGKYCELITKGTTPTSLGRSFTTSGVNFVKAESVSASGRILGAKLAFIDSLTHEILRRSQLSSGDLLISIAGVLGRVGVVDDKDLPANTNQALSIVRLSKTSKLRRDYLNYQLRSPAIAKQISDIGVQAAQANISLQDVGNFLIPLPPTKLEQQAIAEALSDADALIEGLEALIAKKRQLKQGAMQELLRPKDTWGSAKLGDVADPYKQWSFTGGPFGSNLKSSDYTNEGVRIIQLQNIGDGEFKSSDEVYTSLKKANELLSCNIYPGDIILSKMGDPVARACIIPALSSRYLMCSDGIRLAVDKRRFNTYFIYTVINAPEFREKAANAGTGSTRKRIGLTELRALEIRSPALEEQNAIAAILSDMDAEIAVLEGKLAKARRVKAGMMQDLLTGRVRLI